MVSGGYYDITGTGTTDTSETLEKDGGSAWQLVASLPSKRFGLKGVGLDNGRFLVTGQSSKKGFKKRVLMHDAWQVV